MVLFIFNYTKDASDQDLGVPSAFVVLIDHVIEDPSRKFCTLEGRG